VSIACSVAHNRAVNYISELSFSVDFSVPGHGSALPCRCACSRVAVAKQGPNRPCVATCRNSAWISNNVYMLSVVVQTTSSQDS